MFNIGTKSYRIIALKRYDYDVSIVIVAKAYKKLLYARYPFALFQCHLELNNFPLNTSTNK